MKNAFINFLQFIVSNNLVFLKLKDVMFSNPSEHLFRVIKYAKQNYSSKLHLAIIDIGAADGRTAAYLSGTFKHAKIIAIEPIAKMCKIAMKNNVKNPNVSFRNLALSNSGGEAEINITANFFSSSLHPFNDVEMGLQPKTQQEKYKVIGKQKVSTSTLDHETADLSEILLIKIDTQGSEMNILKSGIETLKKTNLLLIEMNNHSLYNNGCQYYEVDEFLRENNFKLIDIIVTYRPMGVAQEYDAIYERIS